MILAGSAGANPDAPTLASDTAVAEAGSYRLHWSAAGRAVELQEAPTAAFASPQPLYLGTDSATVISGRPNGSWHYRVRFLDPPGPWSVPVQVRVLHHSLTKAFGFFAVGAVVFLATVGLILAGGRREGLDRRV